jgi:hypothetical protein
MYALAGVGGKNETRAIEDSSEDSFDHVSYSMTVLCDVDSYTEVGECVDDNLPIDIFSQQ